MSRPLSKRSQAASALVLLLERERTGDLTLTTQIQRAIRLLILDGHLREGDRLPSSRLLSNEAGLSRDTVEAAYQQLETEGFIARKQGSGTFVAATEHGFLSRPLASKLKAGRRRPLPSAPTLSARGSAIARSGGVIDHNEARPFVIIPDVEQFPLEIWQKLTARVLRRRPRTELLYADAQGDMALRQELVRYLGAHRGVKCSASQILVLNSSQQALGLIASMLLDVGGHIAVEDPGFHGAQQVYAAAGLELVPIPVDDQGLVTARLEASRPPVRAVFVTPSHQYPLGITLSLERRLALIDWAARTKAWIIEDDYDSEFRYDGRPLAAIQSLDLSERVLYVGTFSKVLFPGLRLAYLVLPERLMPAFIAARTLADGHTPKIAQSVLAEFMREGHFTAHIRRMRKLYHARRDLFCGLLDADLSAFASYAKPAGGLHIAARLREDLDEETTVQAAARRGIELPRLSRLYLNSKASQGWILGFAALPPQAAGKAMRALAQELARMQTRR